MAVSRYILKRQLLIILSGRDSNPYGIPNSFGEEIKKYDCTKLNEQKHFST